MLKLASIAAVLTLALMAAPAVAQSPVARLEDIPIFPGLTLVSEETPSEGGGLTDFVGAPLPFLGGTRRVYVTTAAPEEVYAFYHAELGGKIETDDSDSYLYRDAGESTPVIRSWDNWILTREDQDSGGGLVTPARQRAVMAGGRAPGPDGEWMRSGGFVWVSLDEQARPTTFAVMVGDHSVLPGWAGYRQETRVEVHVDRFDVSPEDDEGSWS